MRLTDTIEQVIQRYLIDVDVDHGLSPCFVRGMLRDLLKNGNLRQESADRQLITKALSNQSLSESELVSANPGIRWLCTRYTHLPSCKNDFYESNRRSRVNFLLRGGLHSRQGI